MALDLSNVLCLNSRDELRFYYLERIKSTNAFIVSFQKNQFNMTFTKNGLFLLFSFLTFSLVSQHLEPIDVFNIEYVSDPQVSPDGNHVVYVRNFKDIMTDGNRSNLWITDWAGTMNKPLTTGNQNDHSSRWSPQGDKLVYVSSKDGTNQIWLRWMDSGAETKLTNLQKSPSSLSWSPDGKWIAFSMSVDEKTKAYISLPGKPKGAKWNEPAKIIKKLKYKADGAGFVPDAYRQIFILSTEGGTPYQLTEGPYHHGGSITWSPDGRMLYFSANRYDDQLAQINNSEVYSLKISTKQLQALTSRKGPDASPILSPDGVRIAYIGFDDKLMGYHNRQIYIMKSDGTDSKCLTCDFDRSISGMAWAQNNTLTIQYDEKGNTYLASVDLQGNQKILAEHVGGLSIGRPYAAGQFHMNLQGKIAFTHSSPDHPADLAVTQPGQDSRRIVSLNDDLFTFKELGSVEEIWYKSSFDGAAIQGWICKPPGFDPSKKYPLILEIHGGPFANYGNWFSMEVQLYAAAGYVVLYTNPRGSSGYGADFANLIHHNYPNQDYDDLMSGIDAVIDKGYVDADRLYITGGSGGGVLTSWAIGKTDRFKAAVVAKPVINWYSFTLYADNYHFYSKYWFPGKPWDHLDHYMERSPISLVKNVKTPTMLLTGESDYRTPMGETEQYYGALQLQGVESMMVRIPGAGHGIAARPSNLMSKVMHILKWFEDHP